MWVQRTEDEEKNATEQARKEARSRALWISIPAVTLAGVMLLGGWIFSLRGGFVAQASQSQFPIVRTIVIVIGCVWFARFIYKFEFKKGLNQNLNRTICPKCDTPSSNNSGVTCECGGQFVPIRSMKWVE